MSENFNEVLELLTQFKDKPPRFSQFDLFLILSGRGIFPVPYFALILCLTKHLTFNENDNRFLDNSIRRRVFAKYFDSHLAYSHRRYLGYLSEFCMNFGDFNSAMFFFSCIYTGFPENLSIGLPVSCPFLLLTSLYHMPIKQHDYVRILLYEEYDRALDTVLQFLTNAAVESGGGMTDCDLWSSISTLLIILKFKMEKNYKLCSEFSYPALYLGYFRVLEITHEKKAENHALFSRLSMELRSLLQYCLQRPFFQRKLQRLECLILRTCPTISENDLSIILRTLFESGFSDLSVIALYEFLISLDMGNPDLSMTIFDVLTSTGVHSQLLVSFQDDSITNLERCGIDISLYLRKLFENPKFGSPLLAIISQNFYSHMVQEEPDFEVDLEED